MHMAAAPTASKAVAQHIVGQRAARRSAEAGTVATSADTAAAVQTGTATAELHNMTMAEIAAPAAVRLTGMAQHMGEDVMSAGTAAPELCNTATAAPVAVGTDTGEPEPWAPEASASPEMPHTVFATAASVAVTEVPSPADCRTAAAIATETPAHMAVPQAADAPVAVLAAAHLCSCCSTYSPFLNNS
ncbi:hypothetical protein F7D08_1601 [Bifidobacterium cebidarum]|uniref:Uncharacterized protein n=1 Tax=Bifidobacterium cebidarum TaxID=2650773 RepID=A0A6I1G7X9_9BIFI|nr:hypothetical protein F7D08_1601 [Bifidobacterium cebidarum]